MIYVLEYNDKTHQYHYNNLDNTNVRFQSTLFTNGWNPICIVPEDLFSDHDFDVFTDWIRDHNYPYKDAYILINTWVINWMEGRKLPTPEK